MKNSALLVIDVQVGLFETPGYDLFNEKELIETIQSLIADARSKGLPVVYIQHNGGAGSPLEKGSQGWGIHPDISPIDGEPVVEKDTPDSFSNTKLDEVLKSLNITNLIMVGLQTEYCVDTTCRRAKSQGYNLTLVGDAHSTFDTEVLTAKNIIKHHNLTLAAFATVVSSNELELE